MAALRLTRKLTAVLGGGSSSNKVLTGNGCPLLVIAGVKPEHNMVYAGTKPAMVQASVSDPLLLPHPPPGLIFDLPATHRVSNRLPI